MKNYFNFKQFDDKVLLTNDAGKYIFLTKEEFDVFLKNEELLPSHTKEELISKFFIYNENRNVFAERVKESIRKGSYAH